MLPKVYILTQIGSFFWERAGRGGTRDNYSFVGGKPQGPVVHRSPWEFFNVALIQIQQDEHTVGGTVYQWYSTSTKPAEYESETGVSVGVLGVGLIQI